MKNLNSLEELGTLMPDGFKTKKPFEIDNSFSKQNLEAHYSVKGRAGVPVIIIKGFKNVSFEQLKTLSKTIKRKINLKEPFQKKYMVDIYLSWKMFFLLSSP